MSTHRIILAVALAAPLALLGGCASRSHIKGIEQLQENERTAHRIADQAERARRAGESDEAIELYQQALEHSARFHDVWNNLGLLYLQRGGEGDQARAINHFAQAGALDPTDPRPPTNRGTAYLEAGYATDAMEAFHTALGIQPSYLPALRGAIMSADLLSTAQYADLERVKRALLSETDPEWREYFERQRFLIESKLRSAAERGNTASKAP